MVAPRGRRYACLLLLAATFGQAAEVTALGEDVSASTARRDGPWAVYAMNQKCVVARAEPLQVKLKSDRRRFGPSDCSRFYAFTARGGRVVFRAKSEDLLWVLHYNTDGEWTLAKQDPELWDKRQLFESTLPPDGTWCLVYDKSICVKISEHGTKPDNFPTTTPPPTTTTKLTTMPPTLGPKPTKAPTTPVKACPDSCQQPTCVPGIASNGGKNLTDGWCVKYCSQPFGGKRYCGEGSEYKSVGSVDCTGCAKVDCPAACSSNSCKAGLANNGGQELVEGNCRARCSQVFGDSRYCGKGADYAGEGSVDCAGCDGGADKPKTTAAPVTRRRRRRSSRRRSRRRKAAAGTTRRRSSKRRRRRRSKA